MDPISQMLCQIQNGVGANKKSVTLPASKLKTAVLDALKKQGVILDYKTTKNDKMEEIEVLLNQYKGKIIKISKPGGRIYVRARQIPKVIGRAKTVIISTPAGIMSGQQAQKLGLGGEVLVRIE